MLYFTYAMMMLHTFVGVILIGVILLQRGRGGGLAGAFGGMGGQSAFGTKAGDVFTKITIVLATVWIVLGCVCVLLASNSRSERFKAGTAVDVKTAPADEGMKSNESESKPLSEKMPADDGDVVPGPAPANPPDAAKPDAAKAAADATKPEAKPEDGAKPEEAAKPEAKPDAKPEAKEAPATEKPAEPEKKDDAAAKDSADKKPE